jgi:hypothetical protein
VYLKEEKVMRENRNLLIVGAIILICLVAATLATSVPDRGKTYEVEVQNSPEYRTDAARAIDAYERLMERYMDLSEQLVSQMGGNCQSASAKLDSIDGKLTELSTRLSRVEKALGIDPNGNIAPKSSKSPFSK